jgi:manganese/iron transport system permease protein/iron/zinc/copper transport system permease protein
MLDLFYAPLTETYFQKALIGGSIIAMVAGVVGSLVVLRRMAFLGDALSHAMIAGVAGGYLFMKLAFGLEAHAPGMLLGSLIAAVTTVALISFCLQNFKGKGGHSHRNHVHGYFCFGRGGGFYFQALYPH